MSTATEIATPLLSASTAEFYRQGMRRLEAAGVPFLVGGAYAFARYTGIERHTKDFDLFLRREHVEAALDALREQGCYTEQSYPHWLSKAYRDEDFIDLIHGSGCGIAMVDEAWFEHAVDDEVLGLPTRLCPAEEIVWSKAFIQERERYDGADIHHLILARGPRFDWDRLLARFGRHWRVLLGHLVVYGYAFPSASDHVPERVMRALVDRLAAELPGPADTDPVCRGTILSRAQYLFDVREGGLRDARHDADVAMTPEDIDLWTRAIRG